jgi:hypothetical protein
LVLFHAVGAYAFSHQSVCEYAEKYFSDEPKKMFFSMIFLKTADSGFFLTFVDAML